MQAPHLRVDPAMAACRARAKRLADASPSNWQPKALTLVDLTKLLLHAWTRISLVPTGCGFAHA